MNITTEEPRQRRRLKLGISVAAAATIVGGLLAIGGGLSVAQAEPVSSDILAACNSPFGDQHVSIPAVVTDTPDPVTAGNQMTISYKTEYPSNVTNAFSIDLAESTWQMPAQVSSIDAVNYTGLGTFTAAPPVIDNVAKTVKNTFTGGGINKPPTPTITVTVTIDPAAGGQTADWKVFLSSRSISSNIPFVGTIDSTCLPESTSIGQTLNSTAINAPATTTTSSTSTTSTSTSTTSTTTAPGPQTCTQTSSQDGWTKTIWWIGPGGLSNSNGTSDKMYTTDDGLHRFASSVKFAGVGGACAEGGTLPADATVTNASLRLTKTKTCICFGPKQRLHKITQAWSETNLRPNSGPNINGTATAEFSTPGLNSPVDITSTQLTADVQALIDQPSSNEGWSVRQRLTWGDTGNNIDPAGWATREDGNAAKRPQLTITYTP